MHEPGRERLAIAGVGDRNVNGKRERLGRLLAIRRLREDIDRRALQLALGLVAEVEVALSREQLLAAEASLAARTALIAGDRDEWLLAEAQNEVAAWNKDRLNVLLGVRTANVPKALEQFLESRREHEQLKQLQEDANEQAIVEADRMAQKASDDWFLSRRFRTGRQKS